MSRGGKRKREGEKSGIINRSLINDEFKKKTLGGLNCYVFGSLSALIIFMVHIPFKSKKEYSAKVAPGSKKGSMNKGLVSENSWLIGEKNHILIIFFAEDCKL